MLVPQVRHLVPGTGSFTLTSDCTVSAPEAVLELIRETLGPATGFAFPAADTDAGMVFQLAPLDPAHEATPPDEAAANAAANSTALFGDERYRVEVSAHGVRVEAPALAGLRWGVQVLRQLLPVEVFRSEPVPDVEWTLPAVTIEDSPRFPWRGVMIDVARWYKPVAWLRAVADLAALHRLNVLHLHLTDDQGWRFEVKRYPRLTSVGAFRRESPLGHEVDQRGDGTPHGGFYTQEELRDLVAYAARRGVTVVPEIDVPGHSQAAIAAYPLLGNDPSARHEVWTRFGISPRVLSVDSETVDFVRNVLDEVMDVFDSPYVHLGGDEVPTTEWAASPGARKRMVEAGLEEPGQLVGWWIGQLVEHLRRRDRTPIVWDELIDTGSDRIIMAWRGLDRVQAALAAGHRVIATPHTHTYLNYPAAAEGEPLSIASGYPDIAPTPLSKVYGYDPAPPGTPPGVIGTQGNMWMEYAATPERAEYDLMPRLAALAEVAWATAKDEAGLIRRLRHHLRRLDHAGIRYRPMDRDG